MTHTQLRSFSVLSHWLIATERCETKTAKISDCFFLLSPILYSVLRMESGMLMTMVVS